MTSKPIVVQIVGYKNRGKTTLIARLISTLKEQGYRVGTIKHGPHDFDMDHPGTDTWHHREAGADIVSITSDKQTAILEQQSTTINELVDKMTHLDYVLVEGFKSESFPKIVIIKEASDKYLLEELDHVIGAASWEASTEIDVPVRLIDDIDGILHMITNDRK